MAKGAGYRQGVRPSVIRDFKRRCLDATDEGPLFVELHTGLADKTTDDRSRAVSPFTTRLRA